MSYPEYTKCTTPEKAAEYQKNSGPPWNTLVFYTLMAGFVNVAAIFFVASLFENVKMAMLSGPIAIAALVGLLGGFLVYCDWWLKYRLICLDDDNNHCVVGFVAEVESPREKDGGGNFIDQVEAFFDKFDNDFTMNIGIMHTWFTDPLAKNLDWVSGVPPFGYLLKSPADGLLLQKGFTLEGTNAPATSGVYAKYGAYVGQPPLKTLHVEFEGGGVHTLRDWIRALILLLLAAEALSAACSAGLVWACALLIILAVVLPFLVPVAIAHSLSKEANPSDIDKALATLTLGDIVLVKGRWIYDSAHSGWNELHPIRHCQILREGVFDGQWSKLSPPLNYDQWCHEVGIAGSPLTKEEQKKAENTWEIHPLIDGCVAAYVPPDTGPTIVSVTNVASFSNCYHNYTVAASATDPSGIAKLELWYKTASGAWQTLPMVLNTNTGLYGAIIPDIETVTYYVRAYSKDGKSTDSAQYSTFLYCVA